MILPTEARFRTGRNVGLTLLMAPALGVSATVTVPPNTPITIPVPIVTPNFSSMGGAMTQACTGVNYTAATAQTAAQQDLLQQCLFFAYTPANAALVAGWTSIIGEQLDALAPGVKTFAAEQTSGDLSERLAEVRHGEAQGVSLAGLNLGRIDGRLLALNGAGLADFLPYGSGAGSPAFLDGRLGLFVNGDIQDASRVGTVNSFAYGLKNSSVTAGMDYRLTESLVAGAAYTASTSRFGFDNDLGKMDLRENGLDLYGSFYDGPFYMDLLAGYGLSHLKSDRHLSFANTNSGTQVDQDAEGRSHVRNFWTGLSLGGDINWGHLNVNPEASVTYREARMDAFTETMSQPTAAGNGLALTYSSDVVDSLQARFGLRLGTTLSTSWGVFQPQIHGAYIREFRDDPVMFQAAFAAAPATSAPIPLVLQSDYSQSHYYSGGADIHATLMHGFAAFFDYEQLFTLAGIKSHELSFGVRYQVGD
jgi:uncharacterized protein with beta-barrel porin domain